jgi:ubiquinol-cytochrome c reductase cytochrome c1 subunit
VNNKVFPNVGMPNVLVGLQASGDRLQAGADREDGKKQFDPLTGTPLTHEACDQLTMKTGTLTRAVRREGQEPGDLPGLLGQPGQTESQRIGTYVLLYLAFFFVFAYCSSANTGKTCTDHASSCC